MTAERTIWNVTNDNDMEAIHVIFRGMMAKNGKKFILFLLEDAVSFISDVTCSFPALILPRK